MKSLNKEDLEILRIKSLYTQNLLDTLPEKEFDQITFLASQICNTPIALISLVDKERQWFKSKIGILANETSREVSFCSHAILQKDVFVIEDAIKDERFKENDLVLGSPHIRFYAGAPLYSPDGYPIGTVCVIDNKSRVINDEQKKALMYLSEQITSILKLKIQVSKLKRSEDLLSFKSKAFESVSEGIVLQNHEGAIIDFNSAALEVLNLTADELTGKTSMDPSWNSIREDMSCFPGNEHPAMLCLKTGKTQSDIIMGIQSDKFGTRWIKINSVPLFLNGNDKPSHSVTSFADITAIRNFEDNRRILEQKLVESSRLSTLGEMASGIAHEINNPLAIIRGKVGIVKKNINSQNIDFLKVSRDLVSIENTVDRIAKIISGLNTYSRNAENDPFELTNVKTIIDDTLELCREKFKLNLVQLNVNCPENVEIDCRPAQISQILINLLSNSFDAIINQNEKWIQLDIINYKVFIEFIIKDSGFGIDQKISSKIMNPFFTTKEVGKGTGLGLSISTALAQAHGGSLKLDTNQENTTFVFKIPLRQQYQKIA